jgi:hypothetical protein
MLTSIVVVFSPDSTLGSLAQDGIRVISSAVPS